MFMTIDSCRLVDVYEEDDDPVFVSAYKLNYSNFG